MSFSVANTQNGAVTTPANLASTAIALDAGVPSMVYVRWDTALDAAEFATTLWSVFGSGSPTSSPAGEVQGGGTTVKAAATVSFPALTPGTYEVSVFATTGYQTFSCQLLLTVTASGSILGPTADGVPVIQGSYPQMTGVGYSDAIFLVVAGLPVWIQLSATHAPTSWTAAQSLPAGLALSNAGVVSGHVDAAGMYQLNVFASNAAGKSATQAFNLAVIDYVAGGATTGGNSASAALAVTWALPPELLDLQFRLDRRQVLSSRLAACGFALKQGDDVQFALLPSLAGTPITGTITSIKLWLRKKDVFDEPALLTATLTGAPLAPLDVAGNKYWLIPFTLTAAAFAGAFADLNPRAGSTAEPSVAVEKIDCILELRVTFDTKKYTAASVPVTILQSAIEAP